MKATLRHVTLTTLLLLLLTACGAAHQRRQARQLLEQAQRAMAAADYDRTLLLITQLREQCPQAIDERRQALALWQQAELLRTQRLLARTDSLLQQAEADHARAAGQLLPPPPATEAERQARRHRLDSLRRHRDSLQIQCETLGAKIRYIHRRQHR